MNRKQIDWIPYTATPSAPKSHRARVRFLATPELLTFKCQPNFSNFQQSSPNFVTHFAAKGPISRRRAWWAWRGVAGVAGVAGAAGEAGEVGEVGHRPSPVA